MSSDSPQAPQAPQVPTCYRHPGRETYVSCTRCERPICPDCMRDAAVGHQCPECVREGNRTVREACLVFGGRVAARPVVTYVLIAINIVAYVAELASPKFVDDIEKHGQLKTQFGQVNPRNDNTDNERNHQNTTANLHVPLNQGTFGITHILF